MENTPISLQPRTPKEILSVAVLALDIKWADKDVNLKAVESAMKDCDESIDVVVLPELFTTGFSTDIDVLRELAEEDDGPTISYLKHLSDTYKVMISGSFLGHDKAGVHYNRGFMVVPGGEVAFYNKRHLFGPSAESSLFSPGKEAPRVVEYKGWKIGLIVCYDLRFPVWCRRHDCNCQYDVLLVVANWPVSRGYAWEHLLIARAIENQSVVVGADRSGMDDYGDYNGLTRFYDSTGHEVQFETKGKLQVANFSYSQLSDYRHKWPLYKDADSFCINSSI